MLCPSCRWREPCGAAFTDRACLDFWSNHLPGGETVSHPRKPETIKELSDLGGAEFDDIVARATASIDLPLYLPQPRNRSSLRGYLEEGVYAVRARDVIKSKGVISADEMRRRLGLSQDQLLVLLLFDKDALLENMWARSGHLVWQIAEAGYDLVVCPSFSTYTPRPRTEFLINTKRSMLYFEALQRAGARPVARLAWQVSHDARRYAAWIATNPNIRLVALDWGTYRSAQDWRDQLEGLSIFYAATGNQLTYLINGASRQARCEDIFQVVAPSRIRITNSTTQARIPVPRLRGTGDQTGATFGARLAVRRGAVERARAIADTERSRRRAA